MSQLHRAVRTGRYDRVAECLAEGMDPNSLSVRGATPLMIAVQEGFIEIARLILSSGADSNAQRPNGTTALHTAAGKERMDEVELLVQAGAEVNMVDKFSHTAAIWAAMCGRNDIVEFLRQHGADMSIRDREGKTADDWIAIGGLSGQSMKLFRDKFGASWENGERKALDRDVEAVRQQMSEGLSADEYAAKHGRNILIYGYGFYRYDDPEVEQFAHRLWKILSTEALLTEAEETYLVGEELEEARKVRASRARRREREECRKARIAITSLPPIYNSPHL